jgi:Arc/MetJ family transcription regulator
VAITRRRNQRSRIQRKNYRIDVAKLQRTQRILGTRTETETIHKALDLVAEEAGLVLTLRDFVLKGGVHIEDIDARR